MMAIVAVHAREILDSRGNPTIEVDIELEDGIAATANLAEATREADLILLAVPAQFLRDTALAMAPDLTKDTPVAICTKGIERNSGALPIRKRDSIIAVLAETSDFPSAIQSSIVRTLCPT